MGLAVDVVEVSWSPGHEFVLHDANVQVPEGQIRGLLGQPGSGRTAIMRVLLGLVKPDAGRAAIAGLDCWSDAVALHRLVSSRPNLSMWPALTGGETLAFLHRLSGDSNPRRCRHLLDRFGVDPDVPVGVLDRRGRKLLSLAATFCRPARVFLVDDAVAHLTESDERVFAEVLTESVAAGGTVVLTGLPDDASKGLCDEVSIVESGRCVIQPDAARPEASASA